MHVPGRYQPGAQRGADEPPFLRVVGEGQVAVEPDTAEVALGFVTRAEQAADAYDQTAAVMNRVVQVLTEYGIPRGNLQSEQIMLAPIYDQDRLVGYEAAATLRVTLYDLATVGEVIDLTIGAGANRVQGIQFDIHDPRPQEASALTLAAQDAQRKAVLLARALGVGLGPVWRAEAEAAPGPVLPFGARTVALEGMPVLPGTIDIVRRVTVDFVIRYV